MPSAMCAPCGNPGCKDRQNATRLKLIPEGFTGEPAAKDPDEWW